MAGRMRVGVLTALLVAGCGDDKTLPPTALDAGSADAGAPTDATGSLTAQAFEVVIDLTYTSDPTGVPEAVFPRQVTVSMFLDQDAGRPRLRVGGQGLLSEVTLAHGTRTRFSFQDTNPAGLDANVTALQIRLPRGTDSGCQFVHAINLTDLAFDTTGDTLLGQAMGFATYVDGDSIGSRRFSAQLRGTPDRALMAASATSGDVNPFDVVTFTFAEALANVRAELRGPTTTIPLVNVPAALPSVFVLYQTLLPFAQTLTFTAIPALVDLGGNRASPTITVTTLPEPPALVADGFESAAAIDTITAIVSGDVAVITSAQVPGISGAKALMVGPGAWIAEKSEFSGGRFTAKLLVPAGATAATRLRANFHFLSDAMGSSGAVVIRLAAPGGEIVEMQGPTAGFATVPTALPRFPQRSPLVPFEAPLPVGTTDVVYLDVQNFARGCGNFLPPGALVIDDLRVE
jgi:hypothetical protein